MRGFPGVPLWEELSTLVPIMLLGSLDSDAVHHAGPGGVEGTHQALARSGGTHLRRPNGGGSRFRSGLQLQSHLADEGYSIPTIFITAYGEKESRRQAMEAGAVAFLVKPFSDEQLVKSMRSAYV
jgi:DNA-binding NarL/FixJ family response regulator